MEQTLTNGSVTKMPCLHSSLPILSLLRAINSYIDGITLFSPPPKFYTKIVKVIGNSFSNKISCKLSPRVRASDYTMKVHGGVDI
jgi:hypothetical protein